MTLLNFIILTIFLGVSTWDKQEKLDRTGITVLVFDQLVGAPSKENFWEEIMRIRTDRVNIEYHSGRNVSINKLKKGPKRSEVVIFRAHSGYFQNSTWLFTGEKYSSTRHVMDQINGRVHVARSSPSSEYIFAIGSEFIDEYWEQMDGSIVILTGCESLDENGLVDAILDKGATLVIGWRGTVSIDESDEITIKILERLVSGESVGSTLRHITIEFEAQGRLDYSPQEMSDFRVS